MKKNKQNRRERNIASIREQVVKCLRGLELEKENVNYGLIKKLNKTTAGKSRHYSIQVVVTRMRIRGTRINDEMIKTLKATNT